MCQLDRNTTLLPSKQQRGEHPLGTLQPPQLQRGERRLGATVDRWDCGAVLLPLLLWHTCGAWLSGAIAVSLGSFDCLVKSTAKAHSDELAGGAVTAWRRSRHVDLVCRCPSRLKRSTRRSLRHHDWDTMNEAISWKTLSRRSPSSSTASARRLSCRFARWMA